MLQLEQERFGKPPRPFHTLPKEEQLRIEKKRVQGEYDHWQVSQVAQNIVGGRTESCT